MNMAQAFNEWMRRYIETPENFQREFKAVQAFVREKAEGKEPTYGESCAAYMEQLMKEQ